MPVDTPRPESDGRCLRDAALRGRGMLDCGPGIACRTNPGQAAIIGASRRVAANSGRQAAATHDSNFGMVLLLTRCPVAHSATARFVWLFETDRSGRIGWPLVAGSSN